MENVLVAILTLVIGTFLGGLISWFILANKSSKSIKNANKYLENAKIEAEKHKRDTLIELKKETKE